MGLKSNDKAVTVSTIVFLVTFVTSRYLMIPAYYYVFFTWYGSTSHMEMVKKCTYITELGLAAGLVLDILNIVWGKAVFKLAWKTYVSSQDENQVDKPCQNGIVYQSDGKTLEIVQSSKRKSS
ncbi:hypothetical protein Ciccas_012212 [Cichlidogyrus casuarinus]|uniref:Uncharacterized protein n=1 Tax=Cichlidogyrus casuarinus TaxID=1844966 RepID=A0ABD2PP19_9PLAT